MSWESILADGLYCCAEFFVERLFIVNGGLA